MKLLPSGDDLQSRRLSLRTGLRNGLLIGLALGLGAWAPDAIGLSTSHVRQLYPSLLLACLALVLLGGLAGWLAAWSGRALAGALIWFLAAMLMTWVIGHLPFEGRSLAVWLADRRAWGLPVYPFSAAAQVRLVMAGFFILLLLSILGLLQNYRLGGIRAGMDRGARLGGRAWFLLLLPLPLVLGAGLIADNLMNSPLRAGPRLVHEAIRTGRTYPGDLFELSLERGLNYNAIAGVRDQMSADHYLLISQVDLGAANFIWVTAHFDNGAWVKCRVVADQLSACYDASPPYHQGFSALLTTGETPAECIECTVMVDDGLRSWLLARSERFAGSPRITRLAQWGSYVLMRAAPSPSPAEETPAGDHAVECLFHGVSPVRLEHCQEVHGGS